MTTTSESKEQIPNKLTEPMRRVLTLMRREYQLFAPLTPSDTTSPWLEEPGTTRKVYASFITVQKLWENGMIELAPSVTGRPGIHRWHLTTRGFSA